METSFRLNVSDINENFPKVIRTLFKKNKKVEITVQSADDSKPVVRDKAKLYWQEIAGRIKNLEEGKNIVTFTEEEFEKFSNELSARHKR